MIGRLVRRMLGRPPTPPESIASRPGYLWDVAARRWVPVESALCCRCGAYSEFGPVYRVAGLQP